MALENNSEEYEVINSESEDKPSQSEEFSPRDMFQDSEDTVPKVTIKLNLNANFSKVPKVSVPEKIIICIDNTFDKGTRYSYEGLDKDVTPMPNSHSIRNEVLKVFLVNKLELAKDTEFALVLIEPNKFQVLSDFSSNSNKILQTLTYLENPGKEHTIDQFNVTPLFSQVLKMNSIAEQPESKNIPPEYVIRVILLYSNSYIIPRVDVNDSDYIKFMMSPYCILDVMYLHEQHHENNKVEQIYNALGKVVSQRSYLFECSRNVTNVYNNAAKLLAHPFQRVPQNMWNL